MNHRITAAFAVALLSTALASAAPSLTVTLAEGPAYTSKHRFGIVQATMTPQIAIWLETADGAFVDTIYVSHRAAFADWRAAGISRRPESLPAWSHARGVKAADGLYMPEASKPIPDGVSGATPAKGFTKAWKAPVSLAAGTYVVKAELNMSYDWNDAYRDRLPKSDPAWSECNGQPSIVWEGRLELGDREAKASLAPIGSGSLRGESGAVKAGLEGLTSARDIAASIVAEWRP